MPLRQQQPVRPRMLDQPTARFGKNRAARSVGPQERPRISKPRSTLRVFLLRPALDTACILEAERGTHPSSKGENTKKQPRIRPKPAISPRRSGLGPVHLVGHHGHNNKRIAAKRPAAPAPPSSKPRERVFRISPLRLSDSILRSDSHSRKRSAVQFPAGHPREERSGRRP